MVEDIPKFPSLSLQFSNPHCCRGHPFILASIPSLTCSICQLQDTVMSATTSIAVNGSKPSTDGASLDFKDSFIQIIDGKSHPTKETRYGINPANLEPKAKVPVVTKDDLDVAVDAAKRAFKTWSKVPYEDRRKAVLAYADAVDELRTEFRDLLISEQGKPVRYSCFLMELFQPLT